MTNQSYKNIKGKGTQLFTNWQDEEQEARDYVESMKPETTSEAKGYFRAFWKKKDKEKKRKQIIKDIDRLWNMHLDRALSDTNKRPYRIKKPYRISFSSRIASYILKNFEAIQEEE